LQSVSCTGSLQLWWWHASSGSRYCRRRFGSCSRYRGVTEHDLAHTADVDWLSLLLPTASFLSLQNVYLTIYHTRTCHKSSQQRIQSCSKYHFQPKLLLSSVSGGKYFWRWTSLHNRYRLQSTITYRSRPTDRLKKVSCWHSTTAYFFLATL